MSKIKDLKNNDLYNINIVNLLNDVFERPKTKYVHMLMNIFNEQFTNNKLFEEEVKHILVNDWGFSKEQIDKLSFIESDYLNRILNYIFLSYDGVKKFKKFIEYYEQNLIKNCDMLTLTSINDINKLINIVDIKKIEKSLSKEIYIIYDDVEWLVFRPLSYLSSKKYGASTKWCTASENNRSTFEEYGFNGILIYIINRKSGLKVAAYKNLLYLGNYSFWNDRDEIIDSLDSNIPYFILEKILDELKSNKTNYNLASVELQNSWFSKEDQIHGSTLEYNPGRPEHEVPTIREEPVFREEPMRVGIPIINENMTLYTIDSLFINETRTYTASDNDDVDNTR